jgi:hypothetical protein
MPFAAEEQGKIINRNVKIRCGAMPRRKLSILLCEDMDEYVDSFRRSQQRYFDIDVCQDIHMLPQVLRDKERQGALPDLVLLDLFSIKEGTELDELFLKKRAAIDEEVEAVRELIIEISQRAREILKPYGLSYLKLVRKMYPDYTLPMLMWSRLGPFILKADEAAIVEEYDADFLLKLLDEGEQREKIERFFCKWRSPDAPVPLEIARKLSTFPDRLSRSVRRLLEKGEYRDAVLKGFREVTNHIHTRLGCRGESTFLREQMVNAILMSRPPISGEDRELFRHRVVAVGDLYLSLYRIKRCRFAHESVEQPQEEIPWLEADMSLAGINMLWREVDNLIDERRKAGAGHCH